MGAEMVLIGLVRSSSLKTSGIGHKAGFAGVRVDLPHDAVMSLPRRLRLFLVYGQAPASE